MITPHSIDMIDPLTYVVRRPQQPSAETLLVQSITQAAEAWFVNEIAMLIDASRRKTKAEKLVHTKKTSGEIAKRYEDDERPTTGVWLDGNPPEPGYYITSIDGATTEWVRHWDGATWSNCWQINYSTEETRAYKRRTRKFAGFKTKWQYLKDEA